MKLYGQQWASVAWAKLMVRIEQANEHAPTSYKATVDENVPVGTSVIEVTATDLDRGENGYVTYSITNVTPQPFVIEYFSGVISTSEVLDYELMPRIYNLKVRASDWGSPFRREVESSVTITLNNLNDNKPLFENIDCEVTVPRDHGVGEQITTVSAIDADELQLVHYNIVAGNGLDLFELNANSGVLSLKQTLSDGEASKVSFHSLQIVASDGEHETQAMVMNITVIMARKPVQLKCVDTGVATMLAEKLLQGSKIHTQTEPEDSFMDIHSVNRFTPQFAESFPSAIEVKEDLPIGARIVHLSATDTDSGFNGKLVYVISGGDTESRFIVDMEMAARDQAVAEPQLVSTVLLKVVLEDVNDNPPKFVPPKYRVKVREDLPVGAVIMWLEAHDPDVGPSSQVRYSLIDSGDGHFEVDKLSGAMRILKSLNYEQRQVYNLTAKAKDKGKPMSLSSTCFIEVDVVDVNENIHRPFFPSFLDKGFIKEDVPVGTSVMKVSAQDEDEGRDGEIRYSIRDGSGLGIFTIEEETDVYIATEH
ncbi:hypothetical protein CRUP_010715 [Coryphaenoides rupestris]|nr:hypothetical protein CRUP_010715 [Coryphaenoides rupestris]